MSVCVSNLNHTARHACPLFQGFSLFFREHGQEWIRTTEGVSQRIYSPPRLATSVPTRFAREAFYTCASGRSQAPLSKKFDTSAFSSARPVQRGRAAAVASHAV